MKKEPLWKREMKEVLSISTVFFVIFVLFLLMKKSLLDDYDINFYIISTALIASLILAKVVLIFDLLPLTKKTDNLLNIYRVFLRSLIYIFGYIVFTFLEHLIKELIDGESYSQALKATVHHLFSPAFITTFIGVFVAFLFFNAFWVIRANIGTTVLYNMFFRKADNDGQK